MLRRAHRSRNGTLPFGTNKEQQLALMQQQTKESPTKDRLSLPASLSGMVATTAEDSYGATDNDKMSEFPPPSAMNYTIAAPPVNSGESQQDMDHAKENAPMEVNMEDDDRRSHMDLMAENNPLDDDEDEGKTFSST